MTPDQRADTLVALCDTPIRVTREGKPDTWTTLRKRWKGRVDVFERLGSSGAPERELKAAWCHQLEPCNALSAAIGWANDARNGMLVLSGAVGRGKTVAAARYALSTSAAWCHAPLLALDEWSTAAKRVERFLGARHLVIDEIGGPGTTNGTAVARISGILTARHAAARPTVVTTNLSEQEFARIYDGTKNTNESRLVDRVGGSGSWTVCVRLRRTDAGRAEEVKTSFRADGGCDFEKNRYADAKRCLALLEAAENGDVRDFVLDELQDEVACDDTKLQRTFEESASQQEDVARMVERLAETASFNERFAEKQEAS